MFTLQNFIYKSEFKDTSWNFKIQVESPNCQSEFRVFQIKTHFVFINVYFIISYKSEF